MLLILEITQLMAEITALMGTFAKFTIIPKTDPKIFTTFCHAADQLPENTFVINSIKFVRIVITFSMYGAMATNAASRPPSTTVPKLARTGARLVAIRLTRFPNA